MANCKSQIAKSICKSQLLFDGWLDWIGLLWIGAEKADPFPLRPQSAERNQLER